MYTIKLPFVVHATGVLKAKATHLSDEDVESDICIYVAIVLCLLYGFGNFSFEWKT